MRMWPISTIQKHLNKKKGGGTMKPYEKPLSPQEYLMHYGVKGMKWGVRRYQNKDGTLTKAGKERYSQNQQDGVDSFLKSVGSKKVSELTGSVNEDLAIQAVTYVSAFAAVLAVKAVQKPNAAERPDERAG